MALGAFKTVYLLFALATVPQALAGPGCARRNYGKPDCVEKCKHGWGVSGHYMGRNKWGSVMNNTDTDSSDLESIVAVACGLNQTAVADPDATSSDLPCSSSLPSADGYEPTPTPSPAEPSSPEPSPPSSSSSSPPTEPSSPPVPSPSPPGESSPPPAPPSSSSGPVPSSPAPPSPSPTSTPGLTPSPAPSPSPSPSPSPPASSSSSSTPTVQSDTSTLENDALTAHNSFRALHGASPLAWSDDLASAATKWVSRCVFEHSQGQVGDYGENLYAASGTSNSITDAVNAWTSEASQYDPNNPQFSHFTQVVWKSTTQVGCAIFTCPAGSIFDASYGASQFIACEYNPPGNVIGEFADNVQA